MADFSEKYGPWALITGASAGLGADFARELAALGLNTVLVARRKEKLEELGKELEDEFGIQTRSVAADLGSDDFMPALAEETKDLEVGLLINNAGFTNSGDFLDNSFEAEMNLVNLNCRAAVMMAHHYGQGMRDRGRGGIIFSASIAGFAGIPFWATYSASKGFDLLFAEALGSEVAKHGIDVLAMCPGATHTEFATYSGALANIMTMESPEVVKGALAQLGKKRTWIAGRLNRFNTLLTRALPRRVNSVFCGYVIRDIVDH